MCKTDRYIGKCHITYSAFNLNFSKPFFTLIAKINLTVFSIFWLYKESSLTKLNETEHYGDTNNILKIKFKRSCNCYRHGVNYY